MKPTFRKETSIVDSLFVATGDTLTPDQVTALYTDANYGLNNVDNFPKWDPLTYTANQMFTDISRPTYPLS
jgi:hypothetical protein